jgi:hypothetical protein
LKPAVVEGVNQVKGAAVKMYRVPETLSDDVLNKMGALDFQKKTARIDLIKYYHGCKNVRKSELTGGMK